MIDFTTNAIALRRRLWPLFSGKPLLGSIPEDATVPDVAWLRPDGQAPTAADWNLDSAGTVIATLFAEGTRAVLVFHAAPVPTNIVLPTLRPNHRWHRLLDSNPPEHDTPMVIAARSVTVFLEAPEHADEADHTGEAATAGTGGEPLEAAEPAELHRQAPGASDAELDRLADLAGIDPIWWDVDGGFHGPLRDEAGPSRGHAAVRLDPRRVPRQPGPIDPSTHPTVSAGPDGPSGRGHSAGGR